MARDVARRDEAMRQRAPGILLGIGAIVLCLALRAAGLFDGLELVLHDRFVSAQHGGFADEAPVVLVPIGEAEFERFGYPVPDEVVARAIERLREAGRRRSASISTAMVPPARTRRSSPAGPSSNA